MHKNLFYVVLGVTVMGECDILWTGPETAGRERLLARDFDRDQEPRRGGRVHHGLRWENSPRHASFEYARADLYSCGGRT